MLDFFWIIAGIVYVIYKFGQEELEGGVSGGIGCVVAVIVSFLVLGGLAGFCCTVTDNDSDAGTLFWGIILFAIAVGFIVNRVKVYKRDHPKKEKKDDEDKYDEYQ